MNVHFSIKETTLNITIKSTFFSNECFWEMKKKKKCLYAIEPNLMFKTGETFLLLGKDSVKYFSQTWNSSGVRGFRLEECPGCNISGGGITKGGGEVLFHIWEYEWV